MAEGRAAIYARKSTGREEDNYSIDGQVKDCMAKAEALGLSVDPGHVYTEVKSGAVLRQRRELQRLLAAAGRGEFGTVVVWKMNRLDRNQRHRGYLLTLLEDFSGVPVVPAAGTRDPSPLGRAMEGLESIFDEQERERIAERSAWGMRQRIAAGGRKPGPKPPYGWLAADLEPDAKGRKRPGWTLVPNPDEAPHVVEIVRRLAAGESLRSVKRRLVAAGAPTPKGLPAGCWTEVTVKTVARNPIHYGRPVTGVWERQGNSSSRMRPESEWEDIPNAPAIEPLVPEETWRAAQAALDGGRARSGPKKPEGNCGLLSYGRVVCACHGHNLVWRPDSRGRYKVHQKNADRYGCHQMSIGQAALDERVWETVKTIAGDSRVLIVQIERECEGPAIETELAAAEKSLERRRAEYENLVAGFREASNATVRSTLMAEAERAAEGISEAEAVLAEIRGRAAREAEYRAGGERLVAELRRRRAYLDEMGLEDRRGLLERLGLVVRVHPAGTEPDRVEVEIRVMPERRRPVPGFDDPDLPDSALEPYDNRWDEVDWEPDDGLEWAHNESTHA